MKPPGSAMDIEIGASLAEMARLHDAAAAFLQDAAADERTRFAVLFAIEEIVCNIIGYAHDDDKPHLIRLRFEHGAEAIAVEVVDDGRPFDPSAQPPVDTGLAPEQRPLGGLGIFITRGLASDMSYRREGRHNRLSLRFDRPGRLREKI